MNKRASMKDDEDLSPVKRGRAVPVRPWWPRLVLRALRGELPGRERPAMTQRELVSELRKLGIPVGESQLSRTLSGDSPLLHVVQATSDYLGLPHPVVVADTEAEALAIAGARAAFADATRRLRVEDGKIADLAADRDRLQKSSRARPRRAPTRE
jgi:hypothetical protein